MNRFIHSHRWSAIIIWLVTLILLTAVTTVFLEKVLRFSQSINGIERSNIAYYNALSLVEEQLMSGSFTKYDPWNVQEYKNTTSTFSGVVMTVSTGSEIVPAAGKGSSPFDPDYNLISLGDPVQLVIPDGIDWDLVNFEFRIPNIGIATNGIDPLESTIHANSWYILWTFGNSGATLFSSGETQIFTLNQINTVSQISLKDGITNSWSASTFRNFYTDPQYLWTSGTKCAWFKCTLKLSLIRQVPADGGRKLPFLEYKINFGTVKLPNQRMTIDSQAYVNGFVRSTRVYLPQITTNTALDFAILQ
jgi:hypothetical protein